MTKISSFLRDDSGATAIEYGVLAGVIGIGLIGIATVLRTQLSTSFGKMSTTLSQTQGLS